jgi:hypothetical protein
MMVVNSRRIRTIKFLKDLRRRIVTYLKDHLELVRDKLDDVEPGLELAGSFNSLNSALVGMVQSYREKDKSGLEDPMLTQSSISAIIHNMQRINYFIDKFKGEITD